MILKVTELRVGDPYQLEVHEIWRLVAEAVEARLGSAPMWLSTAGLGVHWLHVRLDSRPKYDRHRVYANPARPG
jgi:protoheme ferro-lyase